MKRTSLVLRKGLLEEAVRLSGERTYSRTVALSKISCAASKRAESLSSPDLGRGKETSPRCATIVPIGDHQEVAEFDEIATCFRVVQEVLQGFRDEAAFRTAREAMLAFPMVESPMRQSVF